MYNLLLEGVNDLKILFFIIVVMFILFIIKKAYKNTKDIVLIKWKLIKHYRHSPVDIFLN